MRRCRRSGPVVRGVHRPKNRQTPRGSSAETLHELKGKHHVPASKSVPSDHGWFAWAMQVEMVRTPAEARREPRDEVAFDFIEDREGLVDATLRSQRAPLVKKGQSFRSMRFAL